MKDVEDQDRRAPPLRRYELGSDRLWVPRRALQHTLDLFKCAGRLETCCFWYGVRQGTSSSVAAVVVPRQRQSWGNYHVAADAMRRIHASVVSRGLKNLSQVHSHPGLMVEHSIYDDAMANSRRALSIVIPSYGHWTGTWPSGIGVHEFQNNYWHRLSDRDAAFRVELTESSEVEVIDCR